MLPGGPPPTPLLSSALPRCSQGGTGSWWRTHGHRQPQKGAVWPLRGSPPPGGASGLRWHLAQCRKRGGWAAGPLGNQVADPRCWCPRARLPAGQHQGLHRAHGCPRPCPSSCPGVRGDDCSGTKPVVLPGIRALAGDPRGATPCPGSCISPGHLPVVAGTSRVVGTQEGADPVSLQAPWLLAASALPFLFARPGWPRPSPRASPHPSLLPSWVDSKEPATSAAALPLP